MYNLISGVSFTINVILVICLYNNNKHCKETNNIDYTDKTYLQERMYKDYIAGYNACLRSLEIEKKLQK